jgi:hypothetical protein
MPAHTVAFLPWSVRPTCAFAAATGTIAVAPLRTRSASVTRESRWRSSLANLRYVKFCRARSPLGPRHVSEGEL